jgi:hypothetical protein
MINIYNYKIKRTAIRSQAQTANIPASKTREAVSGPRPDDANLQSIKIIFKNFRKSIY